MELKSNQHVKLNAIMCFPQNTKYFLSLFLFFSPCQLHFEIQFILLGAWCCSLSSWAAILTSRVPPSVAIFSLPSQCHAFFYRSPYPFPIPQTVSCFAYGPLVPSSLLSHFPPFIPRLLLGLGCSAAWDRSLLVALHHVFSFVGQKWMWFHSYVLGHIPNSRWWMELCCSKHLWLNSSFTTKCVMTAIE